jgi:hypothetical protein
LSSDDAFVAFDIREGRYLDNYRIDVIDNTTLQFDLEATFDTYLYIYEQNGGTCSLVARDDDGGDGFNSRLTFRVGTGTFQVVATSFNGAQTGDFTLTSAVVCADSCSSGARRCSGSGYQVCEVGADGCLEWGSTLSCPSSQTCTGSGVCSTAWGDGEICDPCTVSSDCLEDYHCLTYAGLDLGGWCSPPCARTSDCPVGHACHADGYCAPDLTLECGAEDEIWIRDTCHPTPSLAMICESGDICESGECVAAPSCTDECNSGDQACQGAGYVICRLGSDGCTEWSSVTRCLVDQVCEAGVCVPVSLCTDQCDLGDQICSGLGFARCVEDAASSCTVWGRVEPCALNEVCDGGVCELACFDDCRLNATRCYSNAVQICQRNDFGCTEWVNDYTCGSDETCSAGDCRDTGGETVDDLGGGRGAGIGRSSGCSSIGSTRRPWPCFFLVAISAVALLLRRRSAEHRL